MSRSLRDQPQDPVTRAVYWIEYVIRHDGAPHLRSPEMDLNLIQLHSLDVVAALFVLLYAIYWLLRKFQLHVIRLCFKNVKQTRNVKSKIN